MNAGLKYLLAVIAAIVAFSVIAQEPAKEESIASTDVKSVAWYVANIREAMVVNKACYGVSGSKALQATPNCENSLQALKISHVGNN